jgi:subtilase family serine protease
LAVTAYVDGRPVKTESVLLSLTSTAFSFDFSWQVTPGRHDVRIVADPDNTIEESNEDNNACTETFNVAALQVASHPQSSAWQAALLALDGLLSFVVTVRLYGPVKAAIGRRNARKASRPGKGTRCDGR